MRTSYVFLITRSAAPEYVWGAAVAAWCLRKHSNREIHFLVTEAVDPTARRFLAQVGTGLIERQLIDVPGTVTERFRDTYTKLHVFDLVEFERVVYLDADVLPIRSLDDLFELAAPLAAIADPWRGMSNYFNSGVLSLRPDSQLFQDMMGACSRNPRDTGCADQDFMNWWFGPKPRWLRPALQSSLAGRMVRSHWQPIAYEYNAIHLADRIAEGYDPTKVRLVHEKLWEDHGLPEFEQRWRVAKAELTHDLKTRGGFILDLSAPSEEKV